MGAVFHIRQIFCAALLVCSLGLQHSHGLLHIAEVFHASHCKHEPTESKHELTHEHEQHESHCGICQLQLSASFAAGFEILFSIPAFFATNPKGFEVWLVNSINGNPSYVRGPPKALI